MQKGPNPNPPANTLARDLTLKADRLSREFSALVTQYLDEGGDPDQHLSNKYTLLTFSAKYGHEELITLLRIHDANLNLQDKKGENALKRAAQYGHIKIVSQLLESNRVNIDARWDPSGWLGRLTPHQTSISWTPLIAAAIYNYKDIVSLLLEKGANPNIQCERQILLTDGYKDIIRNYTALDAAIDSKSPEIFKVLLQAATDTTKCNKSKQSIDWIITNPYYFVSFESNKTSPPILAQWEANPVLAQEMIVIYTFMIAEMQKLIEAFKQQRLDDLGGPEDSEDLDEAEAPAEPAELPELKKLEELKITPAPLASPLPSTAAQASSSSSASSASLPAFKKHKDPSSNALLTNETAERKSKHRCLIM